MLKCLIGHPKAGLQNFEHASAEVSDNATIFSRIILFFVFLDLEVTPIVNESMLIEALVEKFNA